MERLKLWFETASKPQTFVHVRSATGILGHAKEFRDRVPIGTWLLIQPEYEAATRWLLKTGGWRFHGKLLHHMEFADLLRRED